MLDAFIILTLMGVTLLIIAYRRGDNSHIKGFIEGKNMFKNVLPLLLLAFTIAGFIETLIPAETISTWLGEEAGWKGFFIGPAVGGLVQGGPFTFFPLFDAIFRDSIGTGTAIAMITGWGMLNVGHIPYELAFLGPRFVTLKIASCIAIPPLSGVLSHFLINIL
ncbi:permease [Natranaerofaba carboxydovora]|uniref:permease n=1 Tax=Natranaerofaba carboxydovora TaxID=2742683 RepID=UPI001F130C91|nr:permease [Natranaerofaba carboxydovora]UMZ74660.1 putative permease [Natranaerofaba carboxydovora]